MEQDKEEIRIRQLAKVTKFLKEHSDIPHYKNMALPPEEFLNWKTNKKQKNTECFEPKKDPVDMRIVYETNGNKSEMTTKLSSRDVLFAPNVFNDFEEGEIYKKLVEEIKNCGIPEDKLLKIYDVDNDDNFYNLKNSAVGGWEHCNTDEIKNKRGKSISNYRKGKRFHHLDYDKSGINNPMYGKTQSEETKEKISNKMKGRTNSKKSIIELTTKMHFEKVSEAAKYYGVSGSTMSVLVRNEVIKRGKCKNKIFKYV